MKKTTLILLIVSAFSLNAQVTQNGAPGGAAIDAGAECTDPAGGNDITIATGGVTDTVTFTEDSVIDDINVAVGITHSWRGDTVMDITYDGTSVFLINNPGNVGDADFGATFDDEAGELCSETTSCGLGGSCASACQPTTPLTAFDAKASNAGSFEMRICDKYPASDTGTFDSWAVTMELEDPVPVELLNFQID